MSELPVSVSDVLAMALRNERRGYEILKDGEESAKTPLGKATFEFLASEEINHMRLIEGFADSIGTGAAWQPGEMSPLTKRDAGEKIRSIFDRYAEDFAKAGEHGEERIDIYEAGLQMERFGHHFYSQASNETLDEQAKRLYEFLAKEESRHFELIQDTKDFLELPDALLAIEERWMTI